MQRGNDKHGPRMDEEMEREATLVARSQPPLHSTDWADPENPDPADTRGDAPLLNPPLDPTRDASPHDLR
ncbi:MAG TPA: hypothetical protein VGH99_09545 [Pseudonocardia sp.]|jgi:hypothetical protein